MKKWYLVPCLLVASAFALSAQPKGKIVFDDHFHNYGKMILKDTAYVHVFRFKNEGDAPLTVTSVTPTCKCTVAEWTQTAVNPGEAGEIKISYHPILTGHLDMRIMVYDTGDPDITCVYIRGDIEKESK